MANGPLGLAVKGDILITMVLAFHGGDSYNSAVFGSITMGPRVNG